MPVPRGRGGVGWLLARNGIGGALKRGMQSRSEEQDSAENGERDHREHQGVLHGRGPAFTDAGDAVCDVHLDTDEPFVHGEPSLKPRR